MEPVSLYNIVVIADSFLESIHIGVGQLEQAGEHLGLRIRLLVLCILGFVVLCSECQVHSLGLRRVEDLLKVSQEVLLGKGPQFLDLCGLPSKLILVERNLGPVPRVLFGQTDIFFSHCGMNSLNLLFEFFVSYGLNLLSKFCEESVNGSNNVL